MKIEYPIPELGVRGQNPIVTVTMCGLAEDAKNPEVIFCVIRNRVNHPNRRLFYDGYKDSSGNWVWNYTDPYKCVVLDKWAFSWVDSQGKWDKMLRDDIIRVDPKEVKEWDSAYIKASAAMFSTPFEIPDMTKGATHYYASWMDEPEKCKKYGVSGPPAWAKSPKFLYVTRIGGQNFFKMVA